MRLPRKIAIAAGILVALPLLALKANSRPSGNTRMADSIG
jgi:hypothetical protein